MNPTHKSIASRRILVVDDNVDAADTIRMLLELDGHEVCCAHDGQQAIAAAADFHPDVALLDIGLPGMNGFELARRLRADPSMRHALLVALTGYGELDEREPLMAGFDHHLAKPVEPAALTAAIGMRVPASPRM